nr:zinc finger, CCHC-type [Tanacetum cinerariifolium]
MHFLLTTLKVVYVLSTPSPVWSKNETLETTRKRLKWENDDYICRGHILNGMSDSLFDIYLNAESAKALWESLESKYMVEDAFTTKFLVSNFMNYKMVDTRPLIEQYHEMLRKNQIESSSVNMVERDGAKNSDNNKNKRKFKSGDDKFANKKEPNNYVSVNSIIESRDAIFDEEWFTSIPRPRGMIQPSSSKIAEDEVEGTDDVHGPSVPRKSTRTRKTKSFGSDFQLYLVEGTRDKTLSQCEYYFFIEEDPRTLSEAMTSRDVAFWKKAVQSVIDSIMHNDNWELTDLPPGCKALGCKWILKRMIKVDGSIDKYKARLVIQGFRQKEGIDFFDTYAPDARISTTRLLLALAAIHDLVIHQIDLKTTFLNGDLDEEIYMKQPERFMMPGHESKLEYSRAIGCLMYAMINTRTYIAFAIGKLSSGYPSVIEGYSDASWINNMEDHSSMSGWIFLLGGGVISWASMKQNCITSSTMEFEFVALAAASNEAEWLRNLIYEILCCGCGASGLHINMFKSKIMGIAVDGDKVDQVAHRIGCGILEVPFTYLGSKVGGCMSRIQNWSDVVENMSSRLSKWKMKTLSIGGRLTLINAVLGAMPIYHMFIFKVPLGVLKRMESIRCRFFNGADLDSNKAVWVNWNNVLALKEKGARTKSGYNSVWKDIIFEMEAVKDKGADLFRFMRKRLGDGVDTCFWKDTWNGELPFKLTYPRLYAFEVDKNISVADKLAHATFAGTFRREPQSGIEALQLAKLEDQLEDVQLVNKRDRWAWSLNGSGEFFVASIRRLLDDLRLPKVFSQTRWIKAVPIKVNIWKVRLNGLPSRVNISRRGIDINSILCPICEREVESVSHVFSLARWSG